METRPDDEMLPISALLFSAFSPSISHSCYLAYVLPMLTEFHLSLDARFNKYHRVNDTSFREHHVALALSSATNLDSLYISVQNT